ncbi:MAG: hotdog fold thioesterase [Bacteroidota bacterium]
MKEAEKIVNHMMKNDAMSQWLGIEILSIAPGNCSLRMQVASVCLNGFNIAHGGVAYSLADTALAFSSNAHGQMCYSVETSISHVKTVHAKDVLHARVEEKSLTKRIGVYWIEIINQNNELVALFKGVVHRSDKKWAIE